MPQVAVAGSARRSPDEGGLADDFSRAARLPSVIIFPYLRPINKASSGGDWGRKEVY